MYADKKLPENYKQYVISILVNDEPGVLTRISSLFFKRNFNIDNLTVSPTTTQGTSRITISFCGNTYVYEQMVKQLHKLIDVIKITDMPEDASIVRDLCLLKINTKDAHVQKQVLNYCQTYNAKPVNISAHDVTVELTDEPEKIDDFIKLVETLGIKDIARTGVTAIAKSSNGNNGKK